MDQEIVCTKLPVKKINGKPIADEEDVRDIMHEFYKLDVTSISPQVSYYDQVFHVVTSSRAPSLPTEEYILKLYSHDESKNLANLSEIMNVLVWLDQRDINCPIPLKNINGEYLFLKDLSKEEHGITIHGRYAVCLYTFVKGIPLKNVELTDDMLWQAGEYLAQLQIVLKGVDFPVTRHIDCVWDFDLVKERLTNTEFHKFVKEPEKRKLIIEAFNAFAKDVDSRKCELQKGVIQGDYNEANILVSSINGHSEWHITGIIDFNDLVYTALVYDTAMGLLYMMLMRSGDMVTAGGHFLAGYLSKMSLRDVEKEVIIKIMATRLSMSLITGLEAFSKDPTNLYLLETQAVGWETLHMLMNTPEEDIWNEWNCVIKGYSTSKPRT